MPEARIGVVVEARFAAILEGNPDLDDLLLPSAVAVTRFRADLCLNLHGGTRSAALTIASRSRLRAGFAHFRHLGIYNVRIPRAQEILSVDRKVHTAEHLASAMFYLGAPSSDIPRSRLFAERAQRGTPYAVLHPMASAPDKTWPVERFAEVASHLNRTADLPVFIAGPEKASPLFRLQSSGAAPLGQVKSLLAGASLFVGNDSGPAHGCGIWSAGGGPVWRPDPVVWAPWKTPQSLSWPRTVFLRCPQRG
jgi:ADP-heptose:LPS heptosyltransferase